jgi:hypothetical protein
MHPRGYPRWNNSRARASLKKDVDAILAGTLERKNPAAMHASRAEYLLLPLTVFRNHFYKEKFLTVTNLPTGRFANWSASSRRRRQRRRRIKLTAQ